METEPRKTLRRFEQFRHLHEWTFLAIDASRYRPAVWQLQDAVRRHVAALTFR